MNLELEGFFYSLGIKNKTFQWHIFVYYFLKNEIEWTSEIDHDHLVCMIEKAINFASLSLLKVFGDDISELISRAGIPVINLLILFL